MAPVVHGLEAEYADRLNFAYLDIDDPATEHFKTGLGFRYQPHLFLLDAQGDVLMEWVGPVSRDEMDAAFDQALEE